MTTEIGARLVMDDAASAAVDRLRGGFQQVGHAVEHAQNEVLGLAKQSLAVAVGFELTHGIDSLKEMAAEALNAASGAEEQQKALAGLMAISDRTGMEFDEVRDRAVDLHGELEEIGIKAGVASDQVIEAFEVISSRSQRAYEDVRDLTEQMTNAGKAVPGGVGAIAAAMRDLEAGFIRPKNALIQLLIQTHTVSGTAKEVAKGLSAMVQGGKMEEAFKLAEQAIGKMSDRMKDAPPTFAAVITSLKDIRENLFEAMGVPILATLTPALNRLRGYFISHREAIEHFAESIGARVGTWINAAAAKVEKGFEYLQAHADEYLNAIEKGVALAKEVMQFALDHKGEIAVAFGAKAALPTVIQGVGGAAGAVRGAIGIGKWMADKGAAQPMSDLEGVSLRDLGDKVPMLSAGLGSSVVALGLFAAALASVTAAAWQAKKLWDETHSKGPTGDFDTDARLEAMKRAAEAGDVDEAKRMHAAIAPKDVGMAQVVEAYEQQARQVAAANAQWEAEVRSFGAADNVDGLVQAFNDASKAGNEGRMKLVTDMLAGRDDLTLAFMGLSKGLTDNVGDLIEAMKKVDLAGAMDIQAIIDGRKNAPGAKPPTINFNNSTFNIKQDFRDQDPDRIIGVFRKDLVNAAEMRRSSRLATPFGT